jgi:hypothetical protein
MRLGEVTQISEGIYAYLQPDGSWHLNNTGFLVDGDGVISVGTPFALMGSIAMDLGPAFAGMIAYNGGRPLTCHA